MSSSGRASLEGELGKQAKTGESKQGEANEEGGEWWVGDGIGECW
jgi:hypothetical protein